MDNHLAYFCACKSFSLLTLAQWLVTFEFASLKLNSGSQDCKTSHCEVLLPVVAARLVKSPLRYSGPVIQSRAFALVSCEVELAIAEMACVSRNVRRTFHVPSGVPVQRSISERDCSHPVKLSSEKQRLKPFEVSPHDLYQVACG